MRTPSLLPLRLLLLAAIGCKGSPEDSDSPPDSPPPEALCEDGESLLLTSGEPSGFELCPDGSVNRASAESWDPGLGVVACAGTEEVLNCSSDEECTERPNGRCATGTQPQGGMVGTQCACVYPCGSDADCDPGFACVPPGVDETGQATATCAPAACTSDQDCASEECGLYTYDDGCGVQVALGCRDADDACRADADCPDNQDCGLFTEGPECRGQDCAIGRPLHVEGRDLRADTLARGGWALAVDGSDGDAVQAEKWTQIAAMEHASVASFARFTLQLMALGAPSDLLLETQLAAADEVRHARIAYGIASAHAGRALGPGPLELGAAMPELGWEATLDGLVQEACVGETLGAAEALAEAEEAPEALRPLLREIAEDEARHAALAWRSLAWILGQRPDLRERARAGLEAAQARICRSEERRRLARELIAPCAAALLG